MNQFRGSNIFTFAFALLLIALFVMVSQVQAAPTVSAAHQTNSSAIVNTGALNVRSGPAVSYSVVQVIYQGNSVTLLGRNNSSSWVQIRTSSNLTGWVNASLLTTNATISALPVVNAPTLSAAAIVSTGALNVRSGPGVTYGVLTTVSYGQSVSLLGRASDNVWVRIQMSNNQQGWVNSIHLTPNVTISSLPLADVPAAPVPSVPVAPNAILTLRDGPSFNQPVVGNVFQGQRVKAIARNDNNSWVKVRITETGVEGWILAGNVQLSFPITNLPIQFGSSNPQPTPSPAPSGATAVIATGALNVRSGPSIANSVTAVVTHGTAVELIGRNSNATWVQIRLANNHTGWVNAAYITSNATLTSLPVTE